MKRLALIVSPTLQPSLAASLYAAAAAIMGGRLGLSLAPMFSSFPPAFTVSRARLNGSPGICPAEVYAAYRSSLDVHPSHSAFFVVSSGEFHLAHAPRVMGAESWAAVEANGTGLPSTPSPAGLGALLPSPR